MQIIMVLLATFVLFSCGKDSSNEEKKVFHISYGITSFANRREMPDLPILTDCAEVNLLSLFYPLPTVKRSYENGYEYADYEKSITGKDLVIQESDKKYFVKICRTNEALYDVPIPIVYNFKILTSNATIGEESSGLLKRVYDEKYDYSFQFMTVSFQKTSPVSIDKIVFEDGKEIDITKINEFSPTVKLVDILTSEYKNLKFHIIANDRNGPIYKYLLEGVSPNYCGDNYYASDAKKIYRGEDENHVDYIASGSFRVFSENGENVTPFDDRCNGNIFQYNFNDIANADTSAGKTLKTFTIQFVARGTYSLNSFQSLVVTIKNP